MRPRRQKLGGGDGSEMGLISSEIGLYGKACKATASGLGVTTAISLPRYASQRTAASLALDNSAAR